MIYLSAILIAMFLTIVLVPICRHLAFRLNIIDMPDARRVHTVPTPRTGGIAMALGALAPVLLWSHLSDFTASVMVGAWILVLFGLIDDRRDLNYKAKFAGQLAAAIIVVWFGGVKITSLGMLLPDGYILPDFLAIPLTILAIVGVTNAVNLADGLDGLAGGITLLIFICLGYLSWKAQNTAITVLAASVAGAIIGFLRFNTYPAEVFMGDAGSQYLGFMAVTLSLTLTQVNIPLSPLVPLLLLGFPILDTLSVMLQRVSEGRSPFHPDKNHFHHKLMRLGLYHSEAVLAIYALQALLVGSAVWLRYYSDWLILVLYLAFSGLVLAGFHLADKNGWTIRETNESDIANRLSILSRLDRARTTIKVAFKALEIILPLLFFLTALIPRAIPAYFAWFSVGLAVILSGVLLMGHRYSRSVLRLCLYMTIPFLVYEGQINPAPWISQPLNLAYGFIFLVLVGLVFVTLRLSQRAGFKSTPMDFLILIVALVVPNLPDEPFQGHRMGMVAVKIIVLFFSYEVLIAELRGQLKLLSLVTIGGLIIVSLRGLVL
jgi:UDP-GlcNAc:undecaprenyl-phosphate GlcNAc-1-phosphate transferase